MIGFLLAKARLDKGGELSHSQNGSNVYLVASRRRCFGGVVRAVLSFGSPSRPSDSPSARGPALSSFDDALTCAEMVTGDAGDDVISGGSGDDVSLVGDQNPLCRRARMRSSN